MLSGSPSSDVSRSGAGVVTRLLPRDGGMAEDHGAPELGPEVVEKERVAKERAAQRVNGWAVPNEMKDVLVLITADGA